MDHSTQRGVYTSTTDLPFTTVAGEMITKKKKNDTGDIAKYVENRFLCFCISASCCVFEH